jgi:hypothetical protein
MGRFLSPCFLFLSRLQGERNPMAHSENRTSGVPGKIDELPFMTPHLVQRLEMALGSVGAFGEVRLVVLKGRVRFIEIVRSESLERRTGSENLEE